MTSPNGIFQAWQRTLRAAPDAPVIQDGVRWLSRNDLDREVARWVTTLAKVGRDHRRIALTDTNPVRWLAAFLAIAARGAASVLFDPSEVREKIVNQAAAARVEGILYNGEWQPLDSGRTRGSPPALYKVTSGSTGTPKLLPFTAEQALADGEQVMAGMGIAEDDINAAVIPLGHSYGLGNLVMPLVLRGVRLVTVDSPLPHVIAARIAETGSTILPAVPNLIQALVRAEVDAAQLKTLRLVISAGGMLDPGAAAAFESKYAHAIHVFYGSSETGGIAYDPTGRSAAQSGGVIGPLLPDVSVVLGRGGRVRVSSPAVMKRGSVVLSDLAEFLPTGELRLKGRIGRMAKLGARRVDLAGLEVELRRITPEITELMVDAHPEKEDRLAAAVAPSVDKAALRTAWLSRMPRWKVPERIVVMNTLPRTMRGKIDRAAVRQALGHLDP